MKYEWDENKNRLNIEKHFIDFNDAKEIFNDGCRLEYMVHKNNEDRVVVIGKVNDVVIVVVYTMRHKKYDLYPREWQDELKEKNIKRGEQNEKRETDWNKLKRMSETEIERKAIEDDDSYVATREELMNFKSIEPVKKINVKEIREKMGFSQHRFSAVFGFSMRTLQEWEQGRREPNGAVRNFLKVIARNPKAVQHALLNDDDDEKDG